MSKWRSVKEIPPLIETFSSDLLRSWPLIGYYSTGRMAVVTCEKYDDEDEYVWFTNCSEHHNVTKLVTHWMPLPIAPKE